MKPEKIPTDSRYVPLTQQPYCCAPTSILMVMYRHDIPLISAEELGRPLGLTVPTRVSHLFQSARIADKKPPAGYGTQMQLPEFDATESLEELNIPLALEQKLISEFETAQQVLNELQQIEKDGGDALLSYSQRLVTGNQGQDWGHVAVFDRVVDGKIRLIDPYFKAPKWRLVEPKVMFEAMVEQGADYSGGIWLLEKAG